MDTIHILVIGAALCLAAAGARMIYCGHRQLPHHDRRRGERRRQS